MKTVAITGSIGSGKTTVMNILAERFALIDCDAISHDLMLKGHEGYEQVSRAFSGFLVNGEFDRKALANHVFQHEEDLRKLESILHPLILKEVFRQIRELQNQPLVFIEVPLLFEARWEKNFDVSVLVYAEEEQIVQRLMRDRNMSLEQAQSRLALQMSAQDKRKKADYVLENDESLAILRERVDLLVGKLLENSL